ncbi:methyltransferase domain-containing protein [Pseudolabrys sp.]|uniref:methyltransferase domain-containing protein n=1 Tax=Pseudolabrys sp. TaxID=1960880 RepID=UPI003D12BF70
MAAGVCAFCDGTRFSEIVNFGKVALAGAFVKPEQFRNERKFLLRLWFCHDCYAVQVADHVPPDVLFNDKYFYFSSQIGTLRDHFQRYAGEMVERFLTPANAKVLEFGCNDGVLLHPLADKGVKTVIGVDPSANVISAINDPRVAVINDFFTESVAEGIIRDHGPLDLVMANNVYAHISNIQGTTRAVHKVLKDEGVFVFEVHYLGNVIEGMQYDMIYHEHLYYYSMLSAVAHFRRYGMTIFDVKSIPIHAGSMRFYVCKDGSSHSFQISSAAKSLEAEERAKGFDKAECFARFSQDVAKTRRDLRALLADLREKGTRIAGYGASGRANTIIQYCDLTTDHLDYMIDDAPAKQGYFTPGSHLEILSSRRLFEADAPECVVVFAWAFIDEIRKRNHVYFDNGGKMIVPLPVVRMI